METELFSRKKLIISLILIVILSIIGGLWILQARKIGQPKIVSFLIASDTGIEKVKGVEQGLKRYGFDNDPKIQFRQYSAHGDNKKLQELAQQIVHERPSVIVVTGDDEATAAQKAVPDQSIPIVFVGAGSPVDEGLVKDMNNPGGNITGIDNCTIQLSGKRLEYFKRLLPELQKVTILYDPGAESSCQSLPYLEEVAKKLNVAINPIGVSSPSEAVKELNQINPQQGDGAMVLCSLFFESVAEDIKPVIYSRRIPLMGAGEVNGLDGLLSSYGMPYLQQGEQAARIVAKILNGENPANIPVESPSHVELTVNSEIAKKFGFTLDPNGLSLVSQFK